MAAVPVQLAGREGGDPLAHDDAPHLAQRKGRDEILRDYHLRVGEITHDTHLPPNCVLRDQRLDETETGEAKAVTLVSGTGHSGPLPETARRLGLDAGGDGLMTWDVFEAILTPGEHILLSSWRDAAAARAAGIPSGGRTRQVRIIRDYGMADRREAPQYYPPARSSA